MGNRSTPVDAYPVEFIKMFQALPKQTFTFRLPYNQAVKQRQTIYKLRTAMRKEGHYAIAAAERAFITITPSTVSSPSELVTLTIGLRESSIAASIREQLGLQLDDDELLRDELQKELDMYQDIVKEEEAKEDTELVDDFLSALNLSGEAPTE